MNIEGEDLILPIAWEPSDRDRIIRFFRHVWPRGVYEDAHTRYAGTLGEALRFAPDADEFFIYASQEAWTEWEAEGASAANLDTMVHVIGTRDGITLVVDRAHGPCAGIWQDLVHAVTRNRNTPGAKGRPAA